MRLVTFALLATIALSACGETSGSAAKTGPTAGLPPNPASLHRWVHVPLHYCIETSQAGFVPISAFERFTETAFDTWGVPSINDGACQRGAGSDDGVNEIGWGSLPPVAPGSELFEAGVTRLSYRACALRCAEIETGTIREADIIIESAPPPAFRSTRCLLGTLLHEVGHFLGLEHLPAPAIMEAQTSTCILALTDSDRASLSERYGSVAVSNAAAPTATPTTSNVDAERDDLTLVQRLVARQFSLFNSQSWDDVYQTYAPRFKALCSLDRFRSLNAAARRLDPAAVDASNIVVRIEGDRAYVTYDYNQNSTPIGAVGASDPDVYVRIDGRWYDDIDAHTQCE